MKNFKKIIVSLAIGLVVAVCPLMLSACTKKNTTSSNVQGQITKAVGAAVQTVKNYNSNSTTAVSELNLVEVQEDLNQNLMLVDYMKAVTESSNYNYSTTPFKANINVRQGSTTMAMSVIHSFNITGNSVKVEIVFSYTGTFEDADYECMNINYDFANNKLISFEWYSYVNNEQGGLQYCEYKNNVLKRLVKDDSQEYTSLTTQVHNKAENLYNANNLENKTYNFSAEYVKVYNTYNPNYPIQTA